MPRFRPGLWPTLTLLFGLPLLLTLGTWQVQRLHWKTDLIATLDARADEPPIALPPTAALGPALDYRRVAVDATIAPEPALRFGVARLAAGPAHNVLQAATLADGRTIVVDRGVVPDDTTTLATATGPVPLEGTLRWIGDDERRWPIPINDPAANRWFWYDVAALERAFDAPLEPVVLVLAPASVAAAGPVDDAAPVPQTVAVDLPNNHLGYAITWYGLALSLVVIYGVYGRQRGKERA